MLVHLIIGTADYLRSLPLPLGRGIRRLSDSVKGSDARVCLLRLRQTAQAYAAMRALGVLPGRGRYRDPSDRNECESPAAAR